MLVHDFISIPEDVIPKKITYALTQIYPKMSLSDNLIVNNMNFHLSFSAYWDELGNRKKGLNYYGITIIPNESIPDFINVLKKYEKKKKVSDLIDFCISAKNSKNAIIHFGV